MSSRAPLAIATAALVVSLLGSTSIGRAASARIAATVPYAKTAGFAKFAGDSTKLNGRKSTLAGAPGTIPVVSAAGKLPASIGAVGPKGDKGEKGDPGKIGPSNAYYAHGQSISGLPPGDYVIMGTLVDDDRTGSGGGIVSVSGGVAGGAGGTATIAPGAANVVVGGEVTVPFHGVAHLPNGGAIGANTGTYGTFDIYWIAIKVDTASP